MTEQTPPAVTVNGRRISLNRIKLNQYYKTLCGELLRAGAMKYTRMQELQSQTDALLRSCIEQWNLLHPGGVDFEQREKLSRTIYRNLDAHLFSLGSISNAAEAVQDCTVEFMYEQGERYLRRVRWEITGMTVRLRHTAVLTGNGPYDRVCSQILSALRECVRNPDARRLSDKLDYPPALMSYTLNGMFYLQRYVYHLIWENDFCRRYDPQEIAGLFELYCLKRKLDQRTCKVNLYVLVLMNAIFCEYLDKEPGTLAIYEDECEIAEQLLGALPDEELTQILFRLTDRLIGGNRAYNHRVAARYMHKCVNAIRHKHLKDALTVIEL